MHADKHVSKLVLELSQMLCTAHRYLDGKLVEGVKTLSNGNQRRYKSWVLHDSREQQLYKATHLNHPCTFWVRECDFNYMLTYNLFCELCFEYTRRYGRVHLCQTKLMEILGTPPDNIPFSTHATEFAQAMPIEYKIPGDPVQAYRNYYMGAKRDIVKWNHSPKPEWYV